MIISFMPVPFHHFIPQNPSFGTSLLNNPSFFTESLPVILEWTSYVMHFCLSGSWSSVLQTVDRTGWYWSTYYHTYQRVSIPDIWDFT